MSKRVNPPPQSGANITATQPVDGMIPFNCQIPGIAWPIRIVGYGMAPVDQILFNEWNWRIHPKSQQALLKSTMESIGVVQNILINVRWTDDWPANDRNIEVLLDGHARVLIAARENISHLPATYANLTQLEERVILRILDPLGALAHSDDEKKAELEAGIETDNETLRAFLDHQTGSAGTGKRPRHYVCPECGYEWEK